MRRTKYITSGGLAFNESKDMEKLRKYSLKGWHVSSFKCMGYKLEKGPSADYIYSVDYRSLKTEEAEEYFDFFTSSGWKYITSEGDIHLFQALPGTKPIYSDRETKVEKHDNLGAPMKLPAISLFFATLLVWIGLFTTSGAWQITFAVLTILFSMITFPLILSLIMINKNKWRVEGRLGLVKLTKTGLALFPILLAIIIFAAFDLSKALRIIAAMIIGGVVAPTAVWAIMTLYQRFDEKNTGKRLS